MKIYFIVTFWLAAIFAAHGLARSKNRDATGWALIILLAPVFLLTLVCLPSLPEKTAVAAKPTDPATSPKQVPPAKPAGPWEHMV